MEPAHALLVDIWFVLLGLILVLYVVLDGFDLGVGILSLFSRESKRRRLMMASLSSMWDANETWLIIFAGALFGAFPTAYAVILNALYVPVFIMLAGLIVRGVAFEFHQHSRHSVRWEIAFGAGSLATAVAQGVILATILGGIRVDEAHNFAGGILDWLHPLAAAVVPAVLFGYMLLGATYLVMRTEGFVQRQNRRRATFAALVSFASATASMWIIPAIDAPLAQMWTVYPRATFLTAGFACAAFSFVMLLVSLARHSRYGPFLWAIAVFLFTSADLALTLYPYIIPPDVTVAAAAASPLTLVFMLTGVGMLVPVIMIYNGYVYLVFHGTLKEDAHYGE